MVVKLMLLKRADSYYVCPERSSEEEKVFGGFPQFGAARKDGPSWIG